MNLINQIKNIFHLENLNISERIRIFESSFEVNVQHLPTYEDLKSLIDSVPKRDTLQLGMISDCEDVLTVSNKSTYPVENYNDFLLTLDTDTNIRVNISIDKSIEENTFSVYDFSAFSNDLLSLSVLEVMSSFSLLLSQRDFLTFDLFDQDYFFCTSTMAFVSSGRSINRKDLLRSKRFNICHDTSYFFNANDYKLLPEDFSIDIDCESNPLTELFDRIAVLLSLVYISSTATFESNNLKIQINGQRSVDFCYNTDTLKINKELYKIYQWIYTDGSSIDKAIIARNIISLHCRYSDLIDIDGKTFSSIQSNFNLYLKSNVTQYLELKNKLAEFICDVISKAGDHATQLLGKLKSNLIAIFVFLFTVVLANIVSDQPLQNIFTRDITAIIELVLLGSLIYLVICIIETRYKLKKTKESYDSLKANYKSVLSDTELNEVFNDDKLIIDATKTVKHGIWGYSIVWVVFLFLLIIIVERLSSSPIIGPFINMLRNLI